MKQDFFSNLIGKTNKKQVMLISYSLVEQHLTISILFTSTDTKYVVHHCWYNVLERLCKSFVVGCLDNVHFCFSSDFQGILEKPDKGMQRLTHISTHRHQHTHTRMCSTAQDTLEFAQTEAVCPWVGCSSIEGGAELWETERRCGTEHCDSTGVLWSHCWPTSHHQAVKSKLNGLLYY